MAQASSTKTGRWDTSDWRSDLIALIAGALLPFSLAPYDIWPLGIVSSTVLAVMLVGQNGKRGFLRSVLFGLGMYGVGASWVFRSINDFGFAATPLAFTLTALFVIGLALTFALPFFFYCKYLNKTRIGFLLGFTCIWVLGEWSRSWFLTGFPWLYLGYAHNSTWLAGWAPIGGIFCLSFFVVFSGITISDAAHQCANYLRAKTRSANVAIRSKYLSSIALLAAVIVIWLSGWQLHAYEWTTRQNQQALRVSIVQPNIPQPMKWDPFFFPYIMQTLRDLSSQHWNSDLMLWPENAVPDFFHEADEFLGEIELRAQASNTALITGILYDAKESDTWYNSIIGLGKAQGTYFKQRLVPFGEYVPMEAQLRGLLEFFDLPNSKISAGKGDQQPLQTDTFQIASSICYEVVYPDLVADYADRAALMLTISNDAWFGKSIGPLQHFQMARMRALENGKYLLRATNTGMSGIISHKGEIIRVLPQFTQTSMEEEVYLMQGSTPFSRWKSWPIILACMLGMILTAVIGKRGRDTQQT